MLVATSERTVGLASFASASASVVMISGYDFGSYCRSSSAAAVRFASSLSEVFFSLLFSSPVLPAPVVEKPRRDYMDDHLYKGPTPVQRHFDALKRILDRKEPDYAT